MDIPTARQKATVIARDIVSGQLDVDAGATRIWKELIDQLDKPLSPPDDLWPFKSNASAIEDILWNSEESGAEPDKALLAQCRQDIMDAAVKLLQKSGDT